MPASVRQMVAKVALREEGPDVMERLRLTF